jgi:arginyl-tRNA synthetase
MILLGLSESDKLAAEFEFPERREFGEISSTFALRAAKVQKRAPRMMAEDLVNGFRIADEDLIADARVAGPGYINFYVKRDAFSDLVVNGILALGTDYGAPEKPLGKSVIVEHTSVNPNKPWHVGHLRNAVLGDTISRLLRKVGYRVEVQNYINDAGRQVAEAVYALERLDAPLATSAKFDHFVSQYYIRINELMGRKPELEQEKDDLVVSDAGDFEQYIVDVLQKLEQGVYRELVERVVQAQLQTAWEFGVYYDVLLWENDIVRAHIFEEAIGLIEPSPKISSPTDGYYAGCLIIEAGDQGGRDRKRPQADTADQERAVVLIRSNGIPTYVGKDIAYHLWKSGVLETDVRYEEFCRQPDGQMLFTSSPVGESKPRFEPDLVINVIGDHQAVPQSVVYSSLKLLGYTRQFEASRHLSYGLIRLEEGAMSGRRGVWVSADELLDMVYLEALEQVKARRENELDVDAMRGIAQAISIGAVRFEMCRYNPATTIVFRIKDVLDLRGYCAVYLLYAYVRCLAVLRKAAEQGLPVPDTVSFPSTVETAEFELIYKLAAFPNNLQRAADTLEPSYLTTFGYELANLFHHFYNACPVLGAEPSSQQARLGLVQATATTLEILFKVLGIPKTERI